MATVANPRATVWPAEVVEQIKPQRFQEDIPGVTTTPLHNDGNSYAGLMHLEPGQSLPEHSHHAMAHHALLLQGRLEVAGRVLGPGSYWYTEPGESHSVHGLFPVGASFFYVDIAE